MERATPDEVEARLRAHDLDDALVLDALVRLVGATSRAAVSDAVLPLLQEVDGVRAAAVVLRDRDRVLITGSVGYGCGPMSVGQELPLDAGLPVTEAVRTGRPVVQGTGPSWVAVPFGARGGALLLSLTTAPPADLSRLQRVARALGDAMARAVEQEQLSADLAVIAARLAAPVLSEGVTCRSLPHSGLAGGDVVVCVPDRHGGRWLVVADVCGSGLPAAVLAQAVQAVLVAVLPSAPGPAALLHAADEALSATVPPGSFVTALAVHERDGRVRVASAGHPPLLLLRSSGAVVVEVEPGPPMALEGRSAPSRPLAEAQAELLTEDVLLLHTDGLTDRRTPAGPRAADLLQLVAGRTVSDLERCADELLEAAADVGAAGDDVTLVLTRPSRG